MINLNPTSSGSRSIIAMSISISLGSFIVAYTSVCLTQIADLYKLKNNISQDELVHQLSITTSCFMLGTFLSPILYKKYIQCFGQLKGLLIIDIICSAAVVTQLFQLQFIILIITRFIIGFFIGISATIVPSYITSISPPSMLGKLGSFNQVLQCLGIVGAYLAGYIIQQDNKQDQIRWRIYLAIPLLFFIVRTINLQFIYRYQAIQTLIQQNNIQILKQYSQMVYGRNDNQIIQDIIKLKSVKKISQENASTWRRRFVVAIVIIASNQLTGINSILYYARQLFNKVTHNNSQHTQILMVLLSFMQVLAVLITSQILDKVGRKNMILRGQAGIAICLIAIFLFDKVFANLFGSDFGTVGVILLIFAHIFIMNFTLGPCCIIYCTQILQDITWVIITLKGIALLIALTTDYMIQYIGLGYMFLIFFGLTLIAHLFLRPRLIETKNLSTSEIYAKFGKNKKDEPLMETDQQLKQ